MTRRILAVFSYYFHFAFSDALRCRVCNQALTVDSCTMSVACAADEVGLLIQGRQHIRSLVADYFSVLGNQTSSTLILLGVT